MSNSTNEGGSINGTIWSNWDVYFAAAFGAFCLGLGDLVKNDNSAILVRISEVIKRHLVPDFGEGALLALILLVVLGIVVCWIHSPNNRVDGFARGFSVFAVLAVASPAVEVQDALVSEAYQSEEELTSATPSIEAVPDILINSLIIQSAVANPASAQQDNVELEEQGEVVIFLQLLRELENPPHSIITLRDSETSEIVAQQKVSGSKFRIKKPIGEYLFEIETPGFRRTQVRLTIDRSVVVYTLSMTPSNVPVNLQKLVGPKTQELVYLPAETYKQMGVKSFFSKEYTDAVRLYEKAIEIDPDDAQSYNYKGYTLYRAGKYEKALIALRKSLQIEPTYFFARLNMAKVHCALEEYLAAKDALAGEPKLHSKNVSTILKDGEFRRVCGPIFPEVELLAR